jgi:hypothetical protein
MKGNDRGRRWQGMRITWKLFLKNLKVVDTLGGGGGLFRHTLEYNIKMDVDEIEWESMGCIQVVQNRCHRRALVTSVMNLRLSWKVANFLFR